MLAAATWLAQGQRTVHGAWRAAIAGTAAPTVHRDRVGGPVPRVLSALYKSSLGFSQVLTALALSDDAVAGLDLGQLGDAASFLALLDDGRWWVGRDQVCAGPAAMIGQMFEALAPDDPPARPPRDLAPLGDPAPWIEARVVWVGSQVALLGAARVHAARGDRSAAAILDPQLPCLRGVLGVPGRCAHHARRLFPPGATPAEVEALIAAADRPWPEVRALADRLLTEGTAKPSDTINEGGIPED